MIAEMVAPDLAAMSDRQIPTSAVTQILGGEPGSYSLRAFGPARLRRRQPRHGGFGLRTPT